MSVLRTEEAADKEGSARRALIEAAGQLFAQKGYNQVSVREICKEADFNTAAVNYYFGSKKDLFIQVVRYAFAQVRTDRTEDEALPAEQQLRRFIELTLQHIISQNQSQNHPQWHQQLMLRVMNEDAGLFQEAMHSVIKSEFSELHDIVKRLMPHEDARKRHLVCFSILGQCLFFHHNRMLVQIIEPSLLDEKSIGILADHIVSFSLLTIKQSKK